MRIIKLLTTFAALAFAGTAFGADINLTPGDCNIGVNCWTISDDPSNPSTSEIEALVGTTGLHMQYKANVGGSEEGPLALNYSTSFDNTPADPADAWITWDGINAVDCSTGCYLVVKGGNHIPNAYIFDISSWDGVSDIHLSGFWPGNGAISNVAIYSGAIRTVPEPGTLVLLGTGLLALGFTRRRSRRRA